MKTKSIRLTPEMIKVLDDMKAGKKVDGKGYYKRDMKYDDVIRELLQYKSDSRLLDLLCKMLFDQPRSVFKASSSDVKCAFDEYLKSVNVE